MGIILYLAQISGWSMAQATEMEVETGTCRGLEYLERKLKSMMSQDLQVGGGCANGALSRRA